MGKGEKCLNECVKRGEEELREGWYRLSIGDVMGGWFVGRGKVEMFSSRARPYGTIHCYFGKGSQRLKMILGIGLCKYIQRWVSQKVVYGSERREIESKNSFLF